MTQKVSLNRQIGALERYRVIGPHALKKQGMNPSEVGMMQGDLEAAITTMKWLQQHEAHIREDVRFALAAAH